MQYVWESVGDQDECIRKVCYLGPYLLEHVEYGWETILTNPKLKDDRLMMSSNVYLWNDKEKIPDLIVELPITEYKRDESLKCLEDWYALNVLAEELFTGDPDEPVRKETTKNRTRSARRAT